MIRRSSYAALTIALLALSSCSGGGSSAPRGTVPVAGDAAAAAGFESAPDAINRSSELTDNEDGRLLLDADDGKAILPLLRHNLTIGSTVVNGELNPYGLDIAKRNAGVIKAGDLIVCNFNDPANVQGTGSTILALHPVIGATPTLVAQDPSLLGCDALAVVKDGTIWNAAFAANDVPLVAPNGTIATTFSNGPWHGPFGAAFADRHGAFGKAAVYVTNAGDGSIVRVNLLSHGGFSFDVIATGFAINGGAPGSILGPSGLQYDDAHDDLFIVDGADDSLTLFQHVSTIPAGGITVKGTGFAGRFRNRAHRVFAGAPLNGPISAALLPGGHIVLGNTLDPDGTNLMVEIAPARGRLVATKNVDTGAAAALFGMVATGHHDDDTQIFYNDDNANAVMVLRR